jgi:hypothetical protein
MKRTLLGVALVSGIMFFASSVFANPALLRKHEGYPDETGKATTATGAAAAEKAAQDAPKELKNQNLSATDGQSDSLKRGEARALPTPTGPGYVGKGVSENHIKEATKVNASPR